MEDENISLAKISDLSPEQSISENSEKSGNRLCPLCQSPIRLFYINFNEKFLMCENTECEFPYGHEELKFVKVGEESEDETCSIISKSNGESTASATTGKTYADIEKLNKALEGDEMQSENTYCSSTPTHRIDEDENILKNIQDIKKLHEELLSIGQESINDKDCQIKNEKWIKNLKSLQELSGVQLLRPDEISLLKKEEPCIGLGELKIDIGHGGTSDVPSIRIEIHNTSKDGDEVPADSKIVTDNPNGKDPLPV